MQQRCQAKGGVIFKKLAKNINQLMWKEKKGVFFSFLFMTKIVPKKRKIAVNDVPSENGQPLFY
jgi:hypothetical protein